MSTVDINDSDGCQTVTIRLNPGASFLKVVVVFESDSSAVPDYAAISTFDRRVMAPVTITESPPVPMNSYAYLEPRHLEPLPPPGAAAIFGESPESRPTQPPKKNHRTYEQVDLRVCDCRGCQETVRLGPLSVLAVVPSPRVDHWSELPAEGGAFSRDAFVLV